MLSAEPAPIAVPVTADAPQVTAAAPTPQIAVPAQNDNTALGLGLLGLVALGGAGAYGLARRRRRGDEAEVAYRDERLAAPAPVVTPPTSAWVPAVAAAAPSERRPSAATSVGSAIPAGPLPTGPALASLFEGMATAAPDADNPYTSVKRRRQRVRWLMKQHEHALRDGTAERFDFRRYQSNATPSEHKVQPREVVSA